MLLLLLLLLFFGGGEGGEGEVGVFSSIGGCYSASVYFTEYKSKSMADQRLPPKNGGGLGTKLILLMVHISFRSHETLSQDFSNIRSSLRRVDTVR